MERTRLIPVFPERSATRGRRLRWLRSLSRSAAGTTGAALVALALFSALAAPWLAPHDPAKLNVRSRFVPPVWQTEGDVRYILGTDQLGRDVLSRLIYGSRVSIVVGTAGVALSIAVGVLLGLLAGYLGGWLDGLISRTTDTFMSIPFIILALAAVGVLGPGLMNLIIVLGLTGWVVFARVVRGEVLSIKTMEYVTAARTIGQTPLRIAFHHILPNVTASIIVLATLQVATVIIAESSLSFLGLGVQPPTVTWGLMLADGRNHLATSWWLAAFPGAAISLTALGVILFGDWLRAVLDPRLRAG